MLPESRPETKLIADFGEPARRTDEVSGFGPG